MCGISGIYNYNDRCIDINTIQKLNESIYHRGPDAGDIFLDENVALGHRRLSILDLSDNARQPMLSQSQNFVIVFNGEIYNYKELRQELISFGFVFKNNSDTEVIVNGYEHWGDAIFEKLNGMFALAIFDKKKRDLILARDRFGIKPLYYYQDKDKFIFGSEPKVILVHPQVDAEIDYQGLIEYFWYGNVLGDRSVYSKIKELPPATISKIDAKGNQICKTYYSINNISRRIVSEKEAIENVSYLFENAVKSQLVSDVPVGVFLSGGIDSSAITAYASKHYSKRLKTYTVAFDFMPNANEFEFARLISQKYDTEHSEILIKGRNLPSVIDNLIKAHDMPFGDAADIPLYLLSQELKGSIKVVLQGDGGDELFGGYNRHKFIYFYNYYKNFKFILRLFSCINSNNSSYQKIRRLLSALSQRDQSDINALLLTIESDSYNLLNVFKDDFKQNFKNIDPFLRYREVYGENSKTNNFLKNIFNADMQIILKDTFFEKVDRATMSGSIEARVPFLDNNLVDYVSSLPAELKVKNGISKYLFKESLRNELPGKILDSKKRGFGVPYGEWIKGPLRDYFFEAINSNFTTNILDKKEVEKIYKLHCEGRGNYGFLLWKLMIFSSWLSKSTINADCLISDKKIKGNILCVIDSLGSGGAQRQLVLLAQGLKAKGYNVEFFTYHRSDFFKPILDKLGIKIHQTNKKFAYSLLPLFELRKLLIKNRYETVVSYLETPSFYLELASLGVKDLKVVISERSQVYTYAHFIRKILFSVFHFIPDYIVCNSRSHANWMIKYLPWLKGKILVIKNGLDVSNFKFKKILTEESSANYKLVGLGRITQAKNLLNLAKALHICRAKYKLNLSIDWFGRDDDTLVLESVNKYLIENKLTDYWKWGGEVNKPEDVLTDGYDALICASLWEGFPNAIYEGMASGLPILASSISDIPEIIEDNVSGFLFEPGSPDSIAKSINKFCNLPFDERVRMSNYVYQYSRENISVENLATQYEKLFKNAV